MKNNTFAPTARTLTFYTPDCLSVAATWHTEERYEMFLKYRPVGGEWISVQATAEEGSGDIVYRAVMPSLAPGAEYEYVIGYDNTLTDPARFKTRDEAPAEVKFLYFTDSQEQEHPGRLFSDDMNSAMSEHTPDFILHGGDIVNLGGWEDHWSGMLDGVAPHLTSTPMMPAAGNHEYWDCYLKGYQHTTHRHFTIDLPPQDTANGIYYYFDYGPCRFVVLSSGDTMITQGLCESQQLWAEKVLSQSKARWNIVMIHNPLYSPGKYGSQDPQNRPALVMRGQLNHIFGKYKVDMCLSGHDHVFSLSRPINAEGEVQLNCEVTDTSPAGENGSFLITPKGTVHMIGGCAGDQAREPVPASEVFRRELSEFEAAHYGTANYTAFTVTENALTLEYYAVTDGVSKLLCRRGIIKSGQ